MKVNVIYGTKVINPKFCVKISVEPLTLWEKVWIIFFDVLPKVLFVLLYLGMLYYGCTIHGIGFIIGQFIIVVASFLIVFVFNKLI